MLYSCLEIIMITIIILIVVINKSEKLKALNMMTNNIIHLIYSYTVSRQII